MDQNIAYVRTLLVIGAFQLKLTRQSMIFKGGMSERTVDSVSKMACYTFVII